MAAHFLLVTTTGMTGYETDALIAEISDVIDTERCTVEWLTQETLPPGNLPTLAETNEFSAVAEEEHGQWGPGAMNHPASHMSRQSWSDVANDHPGECAYCGIDLAENPNHTEADCPGCD